MMSVILMGLPSSLAESEPGAGDVGCLRIDDTVDTFSGDYSHARWHIKSETQRVVTTKNNRTPENLETVRQDRMKCDLRPKYPPALAGSDCEGPVAHTTSLSSLQPPKTSKS